MKRRICALLGVGFLLSNAGSAFARDALLRANCQPPRWKTLEVQSGYLQAHVERQCSLVFAEELDLSAFRERFVGQLKAKAQRVHSQRPIPGGNRFDLTEVVRNQEGQLTIRATNDVTLPQATQFLSSSRSTQLTGSGHARYTQAVENRVSVEQQDATTYKLTISNRTTIRKPTLAPTSLLKEKAKEGIEREIMQNTESLKRLLAGGR